MLSLEALFCKIDDFCQDFEARWMQRLLRDSRFIVSTAIRVCHVKRAHQHRVFQGLATWSKTSMGWFFGFKLHLVVNDQGELLDCGLTPGNTDDRKPVLNLLKDCWGKVFADRGYISKALAHQHSSE